MHQGMTAGVKGLGMESGQSCNPLAHLASSFCLFPTLHQMCRSDEELGNKLHIHIHKL